MLLASKAASAGIVFVLLATGISGPRPSLFAPTANFSKEVPVVGLRSEVKTMQDALHKKGRYRGEIDDVFGLRTQASIREFQKGEDLPVTGHLDAQTAEKLGVRQVREETGYQTATGKPSAYIEWAKSSGRRGKILRKAVQAVTASESGTRDREQALQAESDNHPQ